MKGTMLVLLLASMLSISACTDDKSATQPVDSELPVMQAFYTKQSVKVDGLLDDEVWSRATVGGQMKYDCRWLYEGKDETCSP